MRPDAPVRIAEVRVGVARKSMREQNRKKEKKETKPKEREKRKTPEMSSKMLVVELVLV